MDSWCGSKWDLRWMTLSITWIMNCTRFFLHLEIICAIFNLLDIKLCVLVENYHESWFGIKYHTLIFFPYFLYLLTLVCLCAFRDLRLESKAELFGEVFHWYVGALAWRRQGVYWWLLVVGVGNYLILFVCNWLFVGLWLIFFVHILLFAEDIRIFCAACCRQVFSRVLCVVCRCYWS